MISPPGRSQLRLQPAERSPSFSYRKRGSAGTARAWARAVFGLRGSDGNRERLQIVTMDRSFRGGS